MYIHTVDELTCPKYFSDTSQYKPYIFPRGSCWPTKNASFTALQKGAHGWRLAGMEEWQPSQSVTTSSHMERKGAAQSMINLVVPKKLTNVKKFPPVLHYHLSTSPSSLPFLLRKAAIASKKYFTNSFKVLLLHYKAFRHSKLTLRPDSVFQVTSAPGDKFSWWKLPQLLN